MALLALAFLPAPPPAPLPIFPFRDLLKTTAGRLEPSPSLLHAVGKRVRLCGYVADLELPPQGGFWLCPMPLQGDESGGGTADLPPESVFVVVRSSPKSTFRPPHHPVDVTGTLELGPLSLADGTMTRIRLVLDRAAPQPSSPRHPARPATRPTRLLLRKP